jgi:hypothetical protein
LRQYKKQRSKSKKAKESADIRWGKEKEKEHANANANADANAGNPQCSSSSTSFSPKRLSRGGKTPPTDHALFTEWWCAEWENRYGVKYDYTGKDAKHLQALLKVDKLKILKDRALLFFASEDEFIKNAGKTIAAFRSVRAKLIKAKSTVDSGQSWMKKDARKCLEMCFGNKPERECRPSNSSGVCAYCIAELRGG